MTCPRYGFIQYHWEGVGIVRSGKSTALATGIWTHRGLELIHRYLMKYQKQELPEERLDYIISTVKAEYYKDVFPNGETSGKFALADLGEVEDWQGDSEVRQFTSEEKAARQHYTFLEQSSLVEALLRVYCLRILPAWMQKYKIVTVENDMAFPLVQAEGFQIIQSATVDLVVQDRANKELLLWSFKTASKHSELTDKQNSHDTQGLSETWAFEEYLRQKGKQLYVSGIQMLHLVKGQRRETKRGSGVWEQKSLLTRGYRKLGLEGIEYAHSLYFPNEKNDSGIGRLGKGWEPFDVFRGPEGAEVGGIKGWIGRLDGQEYQPECGDILAEQVVKPEAFPRQPQFVTSWLRQTKARELDIAHKLLSIDHYIRTKQHLAVYLDENFPQNNKSCHSMYGDDCPYLSVCWGSEEERWNPLQNGFERRTPHHKAELIQIEGAR